jgi:general L-amino acid transport system permease protein
MNFKNFKIDFKNKKRLIPQVLTLAFIISVIAYFSYNAQINMGNRGISFGYGFLSQEASFDITFSMIDYDGSYSYARAFLVGLLNTLLVSVIGIILCTILGVTIGIGRLSQNYLIAKAAEWYVEIFRNVPLLLQIFFWYYGALRLLPMPENAISFNDISFLTIKGWYIPKFLWTNFSIFFSSVIVSIIAIFFVFKHAKKQREEFGKHVPAGWISIAIFFIIPAFTFLIGGVTLNFQYPELNQLSDTVFNYKGGISIIPELISLALALSMYTATFVAENVRAGIQGVGKGQKEAAASIGLTKGQILKLVVMPQALRIIIPPTTNQYLNLTKNSSLAAAIAYPDIVLVFAGTALMQTGRAIEIISITMGTYLFLSLTISVLMNTYNKKMAIKEK